MTVLTKEEISELQISKLTLPQKPLVIYGAGALGKIAIQKLREFKLEVVGICDSNESKFGTEIEGYTVQSLQHWMDRLNGNFKVVIAVGEKYFEEVRAHLLDVISPSDIYEVNVYDNPSLAESESYKKFYLNHFENCLLVFNALSDELSKKTFKHILFGRTTFGAHYFNEVYCPNQYFNDLTKDINLQWFVDAGAYTGDTLKEFIQFSQNNFEQILSFEPFEECFSLLSQTHQLELNNDSRVRLEKKALSCKDGFVSIDQSMGASSTIVGASGSIESASDLISSKQPQMIETVRLDNVYLPNVSFIKMDIEGSELDALNGAKETIKKYRPKLAICIYHKPEDLFVIPKWIMNLNLEYQYYMRHHGNRSFNQQCETVFYAIPK